MKFTLVPEYKFDRFDQATAEFLSSIGVRAVLLDIDNTMALHDDPEPAQGVREWIEIMRQEGFGLIIVSNNSSARVQNFAESLGLGFVGKAQKPLTKGFRRACRELGVRPKKALVVGDQIFTDILGGNLCGAYTVMVEPLGEHETDFIRFKRRLERPLLRIMDAREKK